MNYLFSPLRRTASRSLRFLFSQARRAGVLLLGLLPLAAAAQVDNRAQPPAYFQADALGARAAAAAPQARQLRQYRGYTLDLQGLRTVLGTAPREGAGRAGKADLVLALPLPDGSTARFALREAPIMAPALAARFPQIKTYAGIGLDDPTAAVRCDVTPQGFHAQILSGAGAVYVEPLSPTDVTHYLVYFKRDVLGAGGVPCGSVAPVLAPAQRAGAGSTAGAARSTAASATGAGAQLRVLRLAVGATAEFTAACGPNRTQGAGGGFLNGTGGTVADALAVIVTLVNQVVGIQEKELAVRLELVAGETGIIYTNSATDPYTNPASHPQQLTDNQTALTAVIGNANYDLGHVFGVNNTGGLAQIGVVCLDNTKAKASSGFGPSTFTLMDNAVNVVAHEMAHQLGATHTFNSSAAPNCSGSNRMAGTAYEPGAGTTIMAYTNACQSDGVSNGGVLQLSCDANFHTGSFKQMQTQLNSVSCNSANYLATGNTAPTVTAPYGGKTLPISTAFKLTAAGTDNEGDALTYSWEEVDLGPAALMTDAQVANVTVPLFRVRPPIGSPSRYFPQLSDILIGGGITKGDRLPTVTRTLKFRCSVRDQHNGSAGVVGGVNYSADVNLNVTSAAGPFVVTTPNSALTWAGNSTQNVIWSVAGTNANGVNCANVNIYLSTNAGSTFPTLLAAGVPNTGSASVVLPNVATTTARILVEAADNYFLDVSNANFTITSVPGSLAVTGLSPSSGPAGTTSVVVTGTGFSTSVGALTVTFGGVPATITGPVTSTSFTATVPAAALTGAVVVTQTGAGAGTANGGLFSVTPLIANVLPAAGAVGASVVISGNSFGGATRVSFNGTETRTFALNTAASPNTITLAVPLGASTGQLLVYTAGGVSNGVAFVVIPFTVSSVSPTIGATGANESANVAVTFSAAANANNSTLAPLKVTSLQAGGRKMGTTTVSGTTVTFDPSVDFRAGEVVRMSVTAAATSSADAPLAQAYTSQFTVRSLPTAGPGAGTNFATGTRPEHVVAGNLNADDALDLVVVNQSASTVSVLLNNGTGTGFTAAAGSPLAVATPPQSATLADLNNDGNLDLLVVCTSGNTGTINVFQGNGNGTFTAQASLNANGPILMLTVGDLNGDGNLDLVGCLLYTNAGYLFTGLGNGSFGFATNNSVGLGLAPQAVVLADFDEDGRLDVATANATGGTVSVRLGDGAGAFAGSTELPAPGANYLVAADLTGDGHLDLASSNTNGPGAPLNVWAGTGAGTFGSVATLALSGSGFAYTLSTGDYDGDGTIDLIAPRSAFGANAGVDIFTYNSGTGSFSAAVTKSGFGNQPRFVAVADVNNDRTLDFITANSVGANTVSVALATPAVPTITGFTPASGPVGQVVVITGTNFTGATAVTFNGTSAAPFAVNSATQITATVAAGTRTGLVAVSAPGGTATSATPFFVDVAAPGNALAFDGADDYGSLPMTAALQFGTGNFTLEAWVRTTAAGTAVAVGSAGGGQDYWLGSSGGKATVSVSGSACVGTSFINDGHWHHLAGVRSGTQLTIYVDGAAETTTTTNLSASPTGNLGIGYFGGGGGFNWLGSLDEVRLWSTARTPAQVNAGRLTPLALPQTGLVAYFNFDLGTAGSPNPGLTTLYDYATGAAATLTNFALTGTASNYVESYALVQPTATAATAPTATSFTATWTAPAVGTATSYLLDVATAPGFLPANAISGSPFAVGAPATSLPLAGLTQSSTYYYRVRALKSGLSDQGAYSNTTSVATPLPVELSTFSATAEGNTAVRLDWTTASEKNSAAFEVERSGNGTAFVDLHKVAAAGNSSAPRAYRYLDAQLPAGGTTLYYRLHQLDLDGTGSYSPVRAVVRTTTASLRLFPNPAAGTTTLAGALPGAAIQVRDALGRLVATATADATGTAALRLPFGLVSGVYVVRTNGQATRLVVE